MVGAMMRRLLSLIGLAVAAPMTGLANGTSLPPLPEWQTDAANCAWHWREGGGIGLWAESCDFNGRIWQVVWDADRAAFVTRNDEADMSIAVQPFDLPSGSKISELSQTLVEAGALDATAACIWAAIALRPAPRTIAFHVLTPADKTALSPTASGDIPEPACGPYGASTHGVRYFITDSRWPDLAIFIDEGQERPLFDSASITPLP
jgi:hypothetical protein